MNEEPSNALYDVCQEILRLEEANQELETINQELIGVLESIVALENTEDDEWDAVERVMPHMVNLARAALAKARGEA